MTERVNARRRPVWRGLGRFSSWRGRPFSPALRGPITSRGPRMRRAGALYARAAAALRTFTATRAALTPRSPARDGSSARSPRVPRVSERRGTAYTVYTTDRG